MATGRCALVGSGGADGAAGYEPEAEAWYDPAYPQQLDSSATRLTLTDGEKTRCALASLTSATAAARRAAGTPRIQR
jgi:hypothetical protein